MSEAAMKTIDLANYDDVYCVQPVKLSPKTLKNLEKISIEDLIKSLPVETAEEQKVKIINVESIIAKGREKRQELLFELNKFEIFLDIDFIKKLKLCNLRIIANFINELINNTFLIKKELYMYFKDKEDFKQIDKDMFSLLVQDFIEKNNFYKTVQTKKKDGKIQIKEVSIIDTKKFFSYLKLNAQNVKVISVRINPFLKKTNFYINKEEKEAVLVKNKIVLKEPNWEILGAVGEREREDILEDYKKLWDNGEKLFDVLDFIVFGRFLSSRKELQLNINAKSSWGKGFFMGVLEDIGAGFVIKQSDFKGDRPSGLNIQALQNAICLLIDEFKKYNNYLFEINNYMFVEEKFGNRYKVDVYARLFFNAQKSESLVGYINEQITNRISMLEIKTDYLLINSKLYNKNKLIYKEVVKEFFYNYFKKKIEHLINLGQIKAEEEADKRIQEIIQKYKIKAKSTDELIVDTLLDFLNDLTKIKKEKELENKLLTIKEKEIANKYVFLNENNNSFYIVKFEQTIMSILKERLEERDYKKIEYSRGELKDILQKFLKAEYKNVHVAELKTKKKALVIKENNIFKYINKEEKEEKQQQENKELYNQNNFNAIDLYNANCSYSANILNDELKNDKNKFLLLTNLNNIFNFSVKELLDLYKTDNIDIAVNYYIKDKVALLKELSLYKTQIKNL